MYKRHTNKRHTFLYDLFKNNRINVGNCTKEICPTANRRGRFGFHIPYDSQKMAGTAVSIFRMPRERLVSAYLFRNGLMRPAGMATDVRKHIEFLLANNLDVSILEYSNFPGV